MQRAKQELSRFVDAARRVGAVPVYLNLSSAADPELTGTVDRDGFLRLEIGPVYAQHDPAALSVSPHDAHPSRLAHSLIANRVLETVARVLEPKQTGAAL